MNSMPQQAVTKGYWNREYLRAQPRTLSSFVVSTTSWRGSPAMDSSPGEKWHFVKYFSKSRAGMIPQTSWKSRTFAFDNAESLLRALLLRLFFVLAPAAGQDLAFDHDLHLEDFLVVRAGGPADPVQRRALVKLLGELLQAALTVREPPGHAGRGLILHESEHEGFRALEPVVHVDGAQPGFEPVGQQGLF